MNCREAVLYCGRAWAGWKESPWHNPYRVGRDVTVEDCLAKFLDYANAKPLEWWQGLWDATHHGWLPLGCWCLDCEVPGSESIVCHCQILAGGLIARGLREMILLGDEPTATNRPTRRGGK